jgi:nicotinamidase-related amidase
MKIIVIVDAQNDFIDMALGSKEAVIAADNIVKYLHNYDDPETLVLFTKDTHHEWYLGTPEGKKLPIPHCIKDTEGWAIDRTIHNEFKTGGYATYSAGDIINGRITKSTFGSYDLVDALCDLDCQIDEGITEIELCGVCTDICVISNAIMIKNAFPDVPIIVDASCCAGVTPEKHAAALEVMKSCQIDVIGE